MWRTPEERIPTFLVAPAIKNVGARSPGSRYVCSMKQVWKCFEIQRSTCMKINTAIKDSMIDAKTLVRL